jgi:hypothetical protein
MIKIVAFCVFHFLRLSERVLPLSVLSFLLWPLAAVWDLLHLRQRTPLTCWRRFPESWRPRRWRFVLRQSLGLYHAQLLYVWPDRLCTARWLSRCLIQDEKELTPLVRLSNNVNQLANNTVKVIYALVSLNES